MFVSKGTRIEAACGDRCPIALRAHLESSPTAMYVNCQSGKLGPDQQGLQERCSPRMGHLAGKATPRQSVPDICIGSSVEEGKSYFR
ncbi:MAG TPA: hypothetical protein VEY10_00885 [Flavisolibacter sp.]|nr:hypothetical protein [Flavisolibacter sp.]